jgi:hypothetical protein
MVFHGDILTIFMPQWHVPICALFNGRIVDRPEHPMPDTLETSGGWVEHEVYMIEGTILIVIELKLHFKNTSDHIAQLLLELVCEDRHYLIPKVYYIDFCSSAAYKVNANKGFKKQPPVYAMLTDLHDFHILRYDGVVFSLYEDEITVRTRPRSEFLKGMVEGSLTVIFVIKIS